MYTADSNASHTPPEQPPAAAAWVERWVSPPPDIAVETAPTGARAETARQIGEHLIAQLEKGRSLYCIVRDRAVADRIGGFDGRALPSIPSEGQA